MAELDSPTGALDGPRADALAARIAEAREASQIFQAMVEELREAAAAIDQAQAAAEEGFRADEELVKGTNLFARVSCPGPDLLERSTNFEHGEIEIESPGMLVEAAVQWRMEGDILLTTKQCRIGPFILDGESPAYLDPETGDLALDLDFAFTALGSGEVTRVDLPINYTADGIRVLVSRPEGRYTIGLDLGGGVEASVRGANGLWTCNLGVLPPSCSSG